MWQSQWMRKCSSYLAGDLSPPIKDLYQKLVKGDRASLARGITLVESALPDHKIQAAKLVQHVSRNEETSSSSTFRIGLSGPPGKKKF